MVGEWPEPCQVDQIDSKTGRGIRLSEVERRRQYLDKMIGEAEVFRPLVEECLDDDPAKRPTIEVVSERIQEIKVNYTDYHPRNEVTLIYCTIHL